MPAISRETKVYLAIWRKAGSKPEIHITLPSYARALAFRMGMYRAIKPYRNGRENDLELVRIGEEFVVNVVKGSSTAVLKPKAFLSEVDDILTELGIVEDDLLSPEDRVAKRLLAGLQRLDEQTESLAYEITTSTQPVNPFYSR